MVFRYPDDPSLDYIKRVVGLPGDRIEYRNKRLFINGVKHLDAVPDYYIGAHQLFKAVQEKTARSSMQSSSRMMLQRPFRSCSSFRSG